MTDTIDTETVLDRIHAALSFGTPICDGFSTNNNSPGDGGWINTSIPVSVNDKQIGSAEIGNWAYTRLENGISADTYDDIKRDGFACRYYEGDNRNFASDIDPGTWQEVFGLSDEEREEVSVWEIEQAILDAAEQADDTEYENVFTAALQEWLSNTACYSTYRLLLAVRALEGEE